jgi:hypothetical protein
MKELVPIERFQEDFMFELTKDELGNWRSQFATSNQDIMGLRIPPFVFEAIKQLLSEEDKPKKKIGFTVKEKQKAYGKKRKRTVKRS